MNAPVDAGIIPANTPDGANEFTFSDATTGVLTLNLKVRKPGVVNQSTTDQAKYTFDVDAIGSSVLSWGQDNPGGKAKVNGEYLTATAIFTGLPQNNSDFGLKTVRLKFDGNEVVNTSFEVFYKGVEFNHPGGDPSQPNWFHYYKQNEGGNDYTFDANASASHTQPAQPNSIQIASSAYTGGTYIVTSIVNGRLQASGRHFP